MVRVETGSSPHQCSEADRPDRARNGVQSGGQGQGRRPGQWLEGKQQVHVEAGGVTAGAVLGRVQGTGGPITSWALGFDLVTGAGGESHCHSASLPGLSWISGSARWRSMGSGSGTKNWRSQGSGSQSTSNDADGERQGQGEFGELSKPWTRHWAPRATGGHGCAWCPRPGEATTVSSLSILWLGSSSHCHGDPAGLTVHWAGSLRLVGPRELNPSHRAPVEDPI